MNQEILFYIIDRKGLFHIKLFYQIFFNKEQISDFILNVIVRGSGAPIAFFANIIIARTLGVKEFGIYMVVLSAAYLISGIAVMGTDNVLIREIAKHWGLSNNQKIIPVGRWGITRVFIFSLVGALLLFIWLELSSDNFGDLSKNGTLAILLLVPASASVIIISSFLTGMGNVKISQAIGNPIRNALLLIGVIFCFFFNKTNQTDKILMAQVVSFILSTMIGWYWIRHKNNGPTLIEYWVKNCQNGNPSEWNLSSWHFFIGTAGILILTRIDIILVNILSDSVTAGFYGAAVRVGQIVAIVGLSGSMWLQPKIVQHLHQNQKTELLSSIKQGTWLIGSSTFLLAIGIYFSADYIVQLLGPDFTLVAGPLRWIGLGYIFWAIGIPFYTFLLMSGSEAKAAKILWGQVFVNLGLLLLLVPISGVHGAVWAWVGGVTFNSALTIYTGLKLINTLHPLIARKHESFET